MVNTLCVVPHNKKMESNNNTYKIYPYTIISNNSNILSNNNKKTNKIVKEIPSNRFLIKISQQTYHFQFLRSLPYQPKIHLFRLFSPS